MGSGAFGIALRFLFSQSKNTHFLATFRRFFFNVHAALKTRRSGEFGRVYLYDRFIPKTALMST
ncbi:MAG: hypothetical protein J6Z02_10055, partial [Lachnospiraceae bacterium]|nr:hypothetical protein [Lachnospiraceae bacterium]